MKPKYLIPIEIAKNKGEAELAEAE